MITSLLANLILLTPFILWIYIGLKALVQKEIYLRRSLYGGRTLYFSGRAARILGLSLSIGGSSVLLPFIFRDEELFFYFFFGGLLLGLIGFLVAHHIQKST